MSLQVDNILQQNCVGVAMEGVNLGRHGQLCWMQVHTAFLFRLMSAMIDAIFLQLRLFSFTLWSNCQVSVPHAVND